MRRLFTIIFLSFSMFIFWGCTASKEAANEKQTLKFTIIIGSGGGFTGTYQGKMIDTTGYIYDWEGRTFSTSTKKIVDSLSQNPIIKLNKYFSENNFTDYTLKEVGNITTFLTLSTLNDQTTFSWKESLIPDHMPTKIKELYYLINDTINNTKKEQK
ncbi:MAG: hypothetical protein M0P61_14605 [Ignavibacteriaceae bacterium]|jgi:hypothetical protein|nr:hypothetical protein [Ignavibacteriaceae bacterium]